MGQEARRADAPGWRLALLHEVAREKSAGRLVLSLMPDQVRDLAEPVVAGGTSVVGEFHLLDGGGNATFVGIAQRLGIGAWKRLWCDRWTI